MSKRLRVGFLAASVAAVLVVSSCSGDDGGSSAGTTAAGGAATTSSSTGSTIDPVVGDVDLGPLAGCTFFTPEDAAAFLGTEVGPVNQSGSQVDGDTILAACAYNDTSGVAENGVSVQVKLVPGSGANLQGDLLDLEQNRFPGAELQELTGVGDGARAIVLPGSDIKLVIVFDGEYEIDVAAGPNQTIEEVVQLAKDTIPKLPQS